MLREQDFAERSDNYLDVLGRLRTGVTIARANQEFGASPRVSSAVPEREREDRGPVVGLREAMSERSRLLVLALCGAAYASCFWPARISRACYSTALLIARESSPCARRQAPDENGSSGSSSPRVSGWRIIGGIVGVGIATAALPVARAPGSCRLPIAGQPSLDWRVLVVAAAIAIVAGLAFGVGPAIGAGRSKALEALRSGGSNPLHNVVIRSFWRDILWVDGQFRTSSTGC